MNAQRRWRTNKSHLLWEVWPREAVIYNSLSGETHYLNHLAMRLLQKMEQGPISEEALSDFIGKKETIDDSDAQLKQFLQQFDQLGLIEPAE